LPGCWRGNGLGFAHPTKRRFITNDAGLEEVALICNSCHDAIECQSHEKMASIVRGIIAGRERPVE
jgi:hypothetical protein